MTKEELNDIIQHSEVSKVQFKERIDDHYKIGTELVAFSNSRGGCLVIGVKDKTGEMNPLSYEEVQDTNEKLSNIATQNVDPHIGIETDTVKVDGGTIVVVTVSEGINKPYKDNKGIIWAKQLFYHANFLLPYSGAGTGIIRAHDEGVEMNFVNDEQIHEFIITIPRKVEDEPANEPAITENEPASVENEPANIKNELASELAKTGNELAFSQRPRLENKEKDIVNFCSVPRSAHEILDRIGVTNQSRHRKKYIQSLVEKGYLSVLMTENGGTKGQRYVKKNNKY